MGVLIRWLVRLLILEVLLRRGIPFIWRKYESVAREDKGRGNGQLTHQPSYGGGWRTLAPISRNLSFRHDGFSETPLQFIESLCA